MTVFTTAASAHDSTQLKVLIHVPSSHLNSPDGFKLPVQLGEHQKPLSAGATQSLREVGSKPVGLGLVGLGLLRLEMLRPEVR